MISIYIKKAREETGLYSVVYFRNFKANYIVKMKSFITVSFVFGLVKRWINYWNMLMVEDTANELLSKTYILFIQNRSAIFSLRFFRFNADKSYL